MSWMVVNKATGKAELELFSKPVADAIDRTRFDVIPAGKYLANLNHKIKADASPFSAEQSEQIADVLAHKLRRMDQADPSFSAMIATLERHDPKRAEEFQAEMEAAQ